MVIDNKDLLMFAVLITAWIVAVVPSYATALHLRRTLDAGGAVREKRLYLYTRSRWESSFLTAALIVGAAGGFLLTPALPLLVLLLAGGIAATLTALLSLLISHKFKYSGDILQQPTRVAIFSLLGIVIFVGATFTIRYINGNLSLPADLGVWGWVSQIGGLVSLVGGLLSIWRQLGRGA